MLMDFQCSVGYHYYFTPDAAAAVLGSFFVLHRAVGALSDAFFGVCLFYLSSPLPITHRVLLEAVGLKGT